MAFSQKWVACLASFTLVAGFSIETSTKTIGVGLKDIGLAGGGPDGVLLFNHTLSPGVDYGYLSHFWFTYFDAYGPYDIHVMNVTVFDYYVDGEAKPSISFNPAYAAGNFFPGPGSQPGDITHGDGDLYSAGAKMGKGSLQGGWYHHHKIPFSQSVVVKARVLDPSITYYQAWIQIRGVEGAPIVLEGGLELPKNARMELQTVDSAFAAHTDAVLAEVPAGYQALVYLVEWGNIAAKDSGYIEGQFHAVRDGRTGGGDLVLGTGVEDYFESAFRFSADYYGSNAPRFYTFADAGLTYFNRTGSNSIESISAYKFHDASDLLILSDGGKVYWEVRGDVTRMRSYVWLYVWPNGQPIPAPTPAPSPAPACSFTFTPGEYLEPVPTDNIWCGQGTLEQLKVRCSTNPSCASFTFSAKFSSNASLSFNAQEASGGCLKGCSQQTQKTTGSDSYSCNAHCPRFVQDVLV